MKTQLFRPNNDGVITETHDVPQNKVSY